MAGQQQEQERVQGASPVAAIPPRNLERILRYQEEALKSINDTRETIKSPSYRSTPEPKAVPAGTR